jgi:5-methylcytosine-specific restriction endonuclease McrA
MNDTQGEAISDPGHQLFDFLRNRFFRSIKGTGMDGTVDAFFNSDGKLLEAERNRIISYSVRRIIHAVKCSMERDGIQSRDTERMLDCIQFYLVNHTALSTEDPDFQKIKVLVLAAIDSSNKKRKSKLRTALLRKAESAGSSKCYICGIELEFHSAETAQSAEVEHHFPRAFGGSSSETNLRLACRSCNSQKADAIGIYDFHFEKISTSHEENHENWKKRLFVSSNALALRLKEGCRCSTCGRAVTETGVLSAFRFEPTDSWHYFNIGMNCNQH